MNIDDPHLKCHLMCQIILHICPHHHVVVLNLRCRRSCHNANENLRNYGFFGRDTEDVLPILCVKCRNSSTGCVGATVVDRKGASDYASSFLTAFIKSLAVKRILVRSDNERSLLSLIERVTNNLTGVELVTMTSPEGDHQANGLAEFVKSRLRR